MKNKYVESAYVLAGVMTWLPIHWATVLHRAVFKR